MSSTGNATHPDRRREYAILALLILIGTPLSAWLGHRDGLRLAAAAYGETADGLMVEAPVGGEPDASAPAATAGAIERGASIFQTHCASCHGANADGKGPASVAFTPPPRDFTDPEARWTLGREPDRIFTAVSRGVDGTGMPGFAAALSEEERWAVTHFLASLPGALAGGR